LQIKIEDYLTQNEIKEIVGRALYDKAFKNSKIPKIPMPDRKDTTITKTVGTDIEISPRILTRNELKKQVGSVCCNCGSTDNIEYHHVVPLSFGGRDVASNIYAVCSDCHALIHFGNHNDISHSEATKRGIELAKQNGYKPGRKPGVSIDTKKAKAAKKIIVQESLDFFGDKNDVEVLKIIGNISRNSYYKYKKELKDEAANFNAV